MFYLNRNKRNTRRGGHAARETRGERFSPLAHIVAFIVSANVWIVIFTGNVFLGCNDIWWTAWRRRIAKSDVRSSSVSSTSPWARRHFNASVWLLQESVFRKKEDGISLLPPEVHSLINPSAMHPIPWVEKVDNAAPEMFKVERAIFRDPGLDRRQTKACLKFTIKEYYCAQ